MKQPTVQALQSAARFAACCLSSLPKGCSSCTDLHSDIEHSLSKTEQKNTKDNVLPLYLMWICESYSLNHVTFRLWDFRLFPFHPFPCQWLKLLIVVHPLGFLEGEFRRHSQVQQRFGQQLSSVVIDRSIDWCITPGVLERPGDFDHGLSADWPNPGVLRKLWVLETLHFRREDKRQAIRIPNVPQSNEVWITMKIINV